MPKMSPLELKAMLAAERMDALSAMRASKLSAERIDAMDYYLGDMAKDKKRVLTRLNESCCSGN